MLNLIESPRASSSDAHINFGAPRLAPRAMGYAGPERRSASSLMQRRMSQLIDAIDYGMLLMADPLHVAMANKAAYRALDAQHPLVLVDDELQARSAVDAQALRDAIHGAMHRGLRRLLHLGEGTSRITVAVVPLAAAAADGLQGVALLLGKRQVCEELTVDWFARAHGLTMAETAVIRGLCADLTPQEIAVRQGVGLATIRTQIGSIRIKTGAGSIRALVRQVAVLPPLMNALQGGLAGMGLAAGGQPALAAHGRAERTLHS